MRIHWSGKALSDLAQHQQSLASSSPVAARNARLRLLSGVERLKSMPRLGERLTQFDPREIRRLLIDQFEIRYEVRGSTVEIIRIWHTRQRR